MEKRKVMEQWIQATEDLAERHNLTMPNAHELERIIDEGLTNKAGLCGLLGLNESNQFRMLVQVQETEAQAQARLRPLVDFLEYLNESHADGCQVRITENRYSIDGGRNWLKITRQVTKQAPVLVKSDYAGLSERKRNALSVLNRLFDYHGLSLDNLGTRLGELIAAKSQVAVISANWVDFLMASDKCSFNSCYKPLTPRNSDTNHFNGTIANFLDGYTLISYLVEQQTIDQVIPSRKSARTWLQVHAESLPYVIWGREYGSWNTHTSSATREPVLRLLRELYCVDRPRWIKADAEPWPRYQWPKYEHSTLTGIGLHYPGFHDESHWSVYRLKGHDYSGIDYIWKYETSQCWACGAETSFPKGGSCESCSDTSPEHVCDGCECGLSEDEIWTTEDGDGYIYCQECYREQYTSCDACGCELYRESDYTIYTDDNVYCEDCYSERYSECAGCNDWFHNDHLTPVHRMVVLRSHRMVRNAAVCERCLRDYFACDECGDYLELEHAVEHEGCHYCSECHDDIAQHNMDNESEAA